jgi:chromatin remodeling complex protein RSC6
MPRAKKKRTKKSAKKVSRRTPRKKARKTKRKVTRKVKRKVTRKATRKKAPRRKVARKKRRPSAAFMKPMLPSAALAEVIGAKPLPRTQVTKKIWAYIKKKKLQDRINRRMIRADAALLKVFGGKSKVDMFQMTKLVSRHLK